MSSLNVSLLRQVLLSNLLALQSYDESISTGSVLPDYRYRDRLISKINFYEVLISKYGCLECIRECSEELF